jgi:hypothetical protein
MAEDMPTPSQSFLNMLAGTMWADRARELTTDLEGRAREREREERLRRRSD